MKLFPTEEDECKGKFHCLQFLDLKIGLSSHSFKEEKAASFHLLSAALKCK
jgi:hypothetical protein